MNVDLTFTAGFVALIDEQMSLEIING